MNHRPRSSGLVSLRAAGAKYNTYVLVVSFWSWLGPCFGSSLWCTTCTKTRAATIPDQIKDTYIVADGLRRMQNSEIRTYRPPSNQLHLSWTSTALCFGPPFTRVGNPEL
jgi:hypothetical protein